MSDLTDRLRDPFDRPARADINALLDEAADALEASERRAAKLDTALGEALDIAQAANDDCKTLKAELVAAQAVIAGVARVVAPKWWHSTLYDRNALIDDVRDVLSQSPTDALQAVKEAAWDEGRERGLNNREGCICRNADHRANDPSMHWWNPYQKDSTNE